MSERLEHKHPGVRLAALQALTEVAEKGDQLAISETSRRLKHKQMGVRWVALQALSNIVEKGDQLAITAAIEVLEDADEQTVIRMAALQALTQVAEKDDLRLVAVNSRLQEDPDVAIRCLSLLTAEGSRNHEGDERWHRGRACSSDSAAE